MQARDKFCHNAERVLNTATVTTRMQVLARTGQAKLEACQTATRDVERGNTRAPHRPVCREHKIRTEPRGLFAHQRLEMLTADLFLTLEQKLEVDRWPT